MTQQFTGGNEPEPQAAAAPEALPQQEEFYRAPARFGAVPIEAEPKGWDRRAGFRRHYPLVSLPIQVIDRVPMGHKEPHEPNRLIWGDNLHVMRQIPSNSVDLIYIDPPFFSGRQYNVIWGDNNELRSFTDIWQGGMDGYLIWLNARLYEMKRILKATGSIYVHCDWHASHYIKVEMDKIFGYQNFQNEFIWYYGGGGASRTRWGRKHDVLFFYTMSSDWTFNVDDVRSTHKWTSGQLRADGSGRDYSRGKLPDDVFELHSVMPWSGERIGYPTQKPEALLERVILASSDEGDVVADFYIGGGTTAAVAQRLGRRWIACDQSRVAVAVTSERLKQQAMTPAMADAPIPDFTIEHWGIYEAARLSETPPEQFRDFVLRSYGATRIGDTGDGPHIHGWRNQFPIWVGDAPLGSQATAGDVGNFANAVRQTAQYQQDNLRDGIMLAWGFGPDAINAASQLREQERIDINFVRIAQVRIGDDGFRQHIVTSSTERADYSEFMTFIYPPVVDVGHRAVGGSVVDFDAGDTAVVNAGAEIINVQWDFNYNGRRFTATPGYSFQREGSGNNRRQVLRATHKFPRTGRFRVACRVQDSRGGEAMWNGEVEVR